MAAPVTLLLCATCEGTDRAGDRQAIEQALTGQRVDQQVRVTMVDCMGACVSPVSIALQGIGRASYVFDGLVPTQDASDIAQTCQTYLNAADGWIEDARPCGRLRDCLRARLPALCLP